MKKILIFSLLIFSVCGCSKKLPESILMVCDGVEVTGGIDGKSGERLVPESVNVKRTIQLNKEKKVVKTNFFEMSLKDNKNNSGKLEDKNVWVMTIDNNRVLFEESSIDMRFSNPTVQVVQDVGMDQNEINGYQRINKEYSKNKLLDSYENYVININRITGQLNENLTQNLLGNHFNISTVGQCKKVDRKI